MHLSASQFCHQGTGCYRIGDALLLSLFVGCYQIAQTEGLGCLGTDQFVARNTGVGRETIFALQDSLSTFDTRNGIAILLADGDIDEMMSCDKSGRTASCTSTRSSSPHPASFKP